VKLKNINLLGHTFVRPVGNTLVQRNQRLSEKWDIESFHSFPGLSFVECPTSPLCRSPALGGQTDHIAVVKGGSGSAIGPEPAGQPFQKPLPALTLASPINLRAIPDADACDART
jgi:hypothetical protein